MFLSFLARLRSSSSLKTIRHFRNRRIWSRSWYPRRRRRKRSHRCGYRREFEKAQSDGQQCLMDGRKAVGELVLKGDPALRRPRKVSRLVFNSQSQNQSVEWQGPTQSEDHLKSSSHTSAAHVIIHGLDVSSTHQLWHHCFHTEAVRTDAYDDRPPYYN